MADTTTTSTTPSSTETPQVHSNGSICWIAIPAADVRACKKFYSELFPSWKFTPATEKCPEDEMVMFSFSDKTGLTGGILKVSAECKAAGELKEGMGVTIYHMVESIDEHQKRILELGGKESNKKQQEDVNGWYQHFLDVAGNRFGLYELAKKE